MITEQHNGSEAAGIINADLQDAGSEVTIGNESGQSVASKLNEVFGDTLITDSLSGSAFAQAVEDGFEGLEPAPPPTPEDDHLKMRFLHISDTHGATAAISQSRDMLVDDDDIEAVIISGDLMKYATQSVTAYYDGETIALVRGKNLARGTIYENEPNLTNINGENKLLYVLGNHDRKDADYAQVHFLDENDNEINTGIYTSSSESKLTVAHRWLRYLLGNSVNYGSATNCAYWYRDFAKTFEVEGQEVTKYVRVIGIDSYENTNTNNANLVCYTQSQVEWLMNLLASTPSDYYLLIVCHDSPFKEASGHTAALAMRPQNAEEANGQKLFVSENLENFHERDGETNVNLLLIIMKAYLEKQNLNTTYTNNASFGVLDLIKDFSNITPATLVGWLCGHIHTDHVGYIPHEDYSDQLLLGIAASDSVTKYAKPDDLLYNISTSDYHGTQWASSEPTYRINELIIDFTDGTLTVKRHGNKTTANVSGRNYGGRVRDEVTFPLVKPTE